MILQSLVQYYERLLADGKVAKRGWCQAKVSFGLNLAADGSLKGIYSLKKEVERGKKTAWVPVLKTVPQMAMRSSGISANFLCDNSKYMLGIDGEGAGKRVQECFEAAREKHLLLLKDVNGVFADAVKSFFLAWNPAQAREHPQLSELWEEVTDGSNLIFMMEEKEAQEDEEIRMAWESAFQERQGETKGICLATGKQDEIARIHPVIRGVQGAQSSGAALVSFNAPSFESYGKEQSYNAPVGGYAAFAYTTALNALLAQREYVFQLGDTTVVFWAESGQEVYQKAFSWSVEPKKDNQEIIKNIFDNFTKGRALNIDGVSLDSGQRFYILGLAPNAARLSVRFFYENSFGAILKNLRAHYQRMEIVRPSWEEREYLGIWAMLFETVNQKSKDKKPRPSLPGAVLKAILSDGRYPESLFINALIRIRAEQGRITWGRAAILKACLIRNRNLKEEELSVGLNEQSNDVPYVLGRLFAVLEMVQDEANPELNTTIRDKYFNAACATPASVFPVLIKLKNSHIRKIGRQKEGAKIYFERLLTELMGKLSDYPRQLNLEEQGRFILGYYHQVQKRYEKKMVLETS